MGLDFMLDENVIATRVKQIIAEQALVDLADVREDMTLEDLELDSLGLIECIFGIEEAFDVAVPFNANNPDESGFDISSVGAIIRQVEGLILATGRMRRVVITGAGTLNPLGADVASTFKAMQAGRCAIGPLTCRDVERLSVQIGAEVSGFDPVSHFTRAQLPLLDRFTQFALVSARQAMAQAGLDLSEAEQLRAGVVLGTAGGGNLTVDDNYRTVYEEGKNRVHPFVVPRLMHNAAASHVSMEFGLKGPGFTTSTACASANHAMGQALMMIRAGMADIMLTGGSEAMLGFGGIKAWEGLRVMSRDTCRPFSRDRSGMVQGEGGAVFVFEERERAIARGAVILAEVAGFGLSSDASDIVMPDRDGPVRAMRMALADAGLCAQCDRLCQRPWHRHGGQ